MTIEISYSEFVWQNVLTKEEKEQLISLSENTHLSASKYNDEVEILLLHNLDIDEALKTLLKKHKKEINGLKEALSQSGIMVSDSSEFQFKSILNVNENLSGKTQIVSFKMPNKINNRSPKIIKKQYRTFNEDLSDGSILTVQGYFNEEFNVELIKLLGNPKIWFQWDNIDGDTRIYNSIEELRDEFDESYYENYKKDDYYYQMGVLIEEKYVPDGLKDDCEKFCKLESGYVDKSAFLETNERVIETLYGITLIEGIPIFIESFIDNIVISKDTE